MTHGRNILILTCAALSGCSTYVAAVAPQQVRGMSVVDLLACAGMPTQKMITRADFFLLEWDPKTPSSSGGVKTGMSLTLPLGAAFSWTPPTYDCHMQATVNRDGTVYDLDFTSSNPVKGADGACAAMVKQCVFDPSSTSLDANYDAFKFFFPDAPTTAPARPLAKTP